MSQNRVLIVDFASEARTVPCGRDIAAALPHGPDKVHAARAVNALGLEVFACSTRCVVHAYRLRGRPVWGIQSHPEMTPEAYDAFLKIEAGVASARDAAE